MGVSTVNGARARMDGKGDPWANDHRAALGGGFNMQDVDAYMGMFAFAGNTAEKLFMEFVPDSFENRYNEIREFAVVALFDRKCSREIALSKQFIVTRQFYLWQCRAFARLQPRAPKFFYVTGSGYPWAMIELDIATGAVCNEYVLPRMDAADWRAIWQAAGLVRLRDELRTWIQRASR